MEHLRDETSTLGCETNKSRLTLKLDGCGIKAVMGVGYPKTVRAEKAEPVAACQCGELILTFLPFGALFSEPAGDNDCSRDALLPAFIQGLRDDFGGKHDDGKVWHLGEVLDIFVGG